MLIYNSQKEFIGIDEKDLKTLGFKNLSDLRAEAADFADLFVKTPGYIHNFKHVHWIDFITCAESNEESKVIINVNNKNFKCVISVETAFLTDNSSAKAYIVQLNSLRELNPKESENISGDILDKPTPKAATELFTTPEVVDAFDEPEELEPMTIQEDPYETPIEIDFDDVRETELEKEEEISPVVEDMEEVLDVGDISFDDEIEDVETQSTEVIKTETINETFENGYIYDPHVASDELGLPLDLIEEFIQDFIAQAKEFKSDLYASLDNGELDNVKILSHKLKGVAANLRVEDAFDVLSVVNTSDDVTIIKENLDTLYKIIAKLAGEEIETEKPVFIEEISDTEDEIVLSFKEEALEVEENTDLETIDDSEVPQKIEIAELADDDFLSTELDIDSIETELDEIEDIDLLELDEEISIDEVVEELELEDEELELELELELEDEEPEALEVPIVKYSKETSATEIGIDQDSFNELFEDYISESKLLIHAMKNALQEDDYATTKHEAIKLKGMSDSMRIDSFTPELETLIDSEDQAEVTKSIEIIEQVIEQISKTGA